MPRFPAHRLLVDGEDVVDDPLVLLRDESTLELHVHGGPWIVRRAVELAEAMEFERAEIERTTVEDWLPMMKTERGVRLLLERGLPLENTLQRMAFPARVALIGPPNVGKSTLANRLLGRDRFITADMPGTTRDWVEELADVGGVPMILTDTPGRRTTDDAIEAEAIEWSRTTVELADLVVAVHDPTTTESWPDCDVRVMNKADLVAVDGGELAVSATTGAGMDALVAALHGALGVDLAMSTSPPTHA
ncbi:MAG: GTPase [Planctomycetota bacterium]